MNAGLSFSQGSHRGAIQKIRFGIGGGEGPPLIRDLGKYKAAFW